MLCCMAEAPYSNDEWEIWRGFVHMTGQLNLTLDRRLQQSAGLSQADLRVLASLLGAEELRLRTGQLADALAWEKSRVSHQVSRMEARGLVEREACEEDLRGTWVRCTATGQEAVSRTLAAYADWIRELLLDHMSEAEKDMLRSLSQRVLTAMGAPEWPSAGPVRTDILTPA